MHHYREYTDQELIALLKEGDQFAFAEIYDRYWATMYAHVFKMLRDRDDTLDLLQDLFSQIWLGADKLHEDTRLAGWLYVAARNRVFNFFQQRDMRAKHLDTLGSFLSAVTDETVWELQERDLISAIEEELEKLPPRVRQVFELSRKEHLTHKEIAERLGISPQTVRKQVQQALRALRGRFGELGVALLPFFD